MVTRYIISLQGLEYAIIHIYGWKEKPCYQLILKSITEGRYIKCLNSIAKNYRVDEDQNISKTSKAHENINHLTTDSIYHLQKNYGLKGIYSALMNFIVQCRMCQEFLGKGICK